MPLVRSTPVLHKLHTFVQTKGVGLAILGDDGGGGMDPTCLRLGFVLERSCSSVRPVDGMRWQTRVGSRLPDCRWLGLGLSPGMLTCHLIASSISNRSDLVLGMVRRHLVTKGQSHRRPVRAPRSTSPTPPLTPTYSSFPGLLRAWHCVHALRACVCMTDGILPHWLHGSHQIPGSRS